MRQLPLVLVLIAALSVAATPVLAATTTHTRTSGMGLRAEFTDVRSDAEGNALPGSYHEASVEAVAYVAVGDRPAQQAYVCAAYNEWTVDGSGHWHDTYHVSGCGTYDSLTVDRSLRSGHVVASVPLDECVVSGKPSEDCAGVIDVNLTLTGFGHASRWHAMQSDPGPAPDRAVYRLIGSRRAARPAGSVTFEGVSLIDAATSRSGYLFRSNESSVEVRH